VISFAIIKIFGVNVPAFHRNSQLMISNKELFWDCKSRGIDWNKKEKVGGNKTICSNVHFTLSLQNDLDVL